MISGFSKLTKEEKINWLTENYLNNSVEAEKILRQYWNSNESLQKLHDEFSENTISNYYIPFGIAPNFLINGKAFAIPMAVEESSVVAAAANAAKFWLSRGGFKTKVLGIEKLGQVHFTLETEYQKLTQFFNDCLVQKLKKETDDITRNMRKRGGGILSLKLKNKTQKIKNYYQIEATFDTQDSMGANFINTCLEQFGKTLQREIEQSEFFTLEEKKSLNVIMCILSNYTPNCIVRAEVCCDVKELKDKNTDANEFATKFYHAVKIAEVEPYRATTHNKGIMNGVDAVVIATGNDFRAVEACVHTYASRTGQYSSLSHCEIEGNKFRFWLDLPLAVGTIGGLTSLHPLVKVALAILGNPKAQDLMSIIAVAGLAQNFAALRSLVTTGIQKGHMKMHLQNILNQLGATQQEKIILLKQFGEVAITHNLVAQALHKLRE